VVGGCDRRRRCDLAEKLDAGGGAPRRIRHLRATAVVVAGADYPPVLPTPPDRDEEGEDEGRATTACRPVPVRPVVESGELERRLRREAAAAGAGREAQ